MKRLWPHDCEDCLYLGPYTFQTHQLIKTVDLYFCRNCDGGTVIARYGEYGGSYSSSPIDMVTGRGFFGPALVEAVRRTRE